jgi:hypothetical protein
MENKSILTYGNFVRQFPDVTPKSKEIAKKLLPLYPSPELAQIVAALMTDGHIDWYTSDGSPRTRKIILYSSNKDECDWFLNIVDKLFGIKGNLQEYIPKYGNFKLQPYKAVIHCAALARILILVGVPAGNKTKVKIKISNWIMNGNRKIKKEFLRTLFTFDGSKPHKRNTTWSIQYSCVTSQNTKKYALLFFKQLRWLLKEFEINISKSPTQHLKKNMKYMIIASISSRKSIINFHRYIGYHNPEKQARIYRATRYIANIARFGSKNVPQVLEQFKGIFGTDKKAVGFINKTLGTKYTYRQFEHFRRGDIEVPIKLFALAEEKVKSNTEVPDWVRFLIDNFIAPSLP